MATLLTNCTDIYQLYNEVDHIVQLVCSCWGDRSGGAGTRDPLSLPKTIRVTVGLEQQQQILMGPPRVGGAATPPGALSSDSRIGATTLRGSGRAILNATSAGFKRKNRCGLEEEFPVPDFLLMESPVLADMHWQNHGREELGPVKRAANLFPAVLVLLKLRWLVRLHCAMVSVAGKRCSLHRLLSGILLGTCSVSDHPPSPVQVYELFTETLKERLQQGWPLFLAFVATHEQGPPRCNDGGAALHAWLRQHGGTSNPGSIAHLWQTIDDIFIAWLVQQDVNKVPAVHVMQELEFYKLVWPMVHTNLEGLHEWQLVKYVSGSQQQHFRLAQKQAHHLALNLELPALRDYWDFSFDEMMEMARTVVAHPKTFNAGVRTRIAMVMGVNPMLDNANSLAADLDDEQFSLFQSHYSAPRDCGRIKPGILETLRDSHAPWLVGRESRFLGPPSKPDPFPPIGLIKSTGKA